MENITKKNEFWSNSPLGKVQCAQNFYLKDYEKYILEKSKTYLPNNCKVLLVGCGASREVDGLFEILQPKFVHGIDLSEELVKKSRENIRNRSWESEYKVEFLDFMSIKDLREYDLIWFSNNVLAYIITDQNSLKQFMSKLKTLESKNNCAIFFEVPKIFRWGIVRNIVVFFEILYFRVTMNFWGLKKINSGAYSLRYKNFSLSECENIFSKIGFTKIIFTTKSIFRVKNSKDDTILGLYVKY
jgi:SAM-dependent methyltransferase